MTKNIIYAIINSKTGRYYIGRTCEFKQRKVKHFRDLKVGEHHSPYLQRAYNKHGAKCFKMVALCHGLERDEAIKFEQLMLDTYFDTLYNCSRSATTPDNTGRKLTEETKRKMSEAQKGKQHTKETKAKMSKAHKGRKRSDETKRKMSEAKKGRKCSDETKRKMSESRKGRTPTEEAKRNMSEAAKRAWARRKSEVN
jgi:group I intron endonuclease